MLLWPFLLPPDFCSQLLWSVLYFSFSHLSPFPSSCLLSSFLLSAYCEAFPCVLLSPTFADLFNLLNPFAYSCCNFPPRLHLNNTKPVYVCQLWSSPILMNIIEHIPAFRRWCQQGCKNKKWHMEAHFSQPHLFSSETKTLQRAGAGALAGAGAGALFVKGPCIWFFWFGHIILYILDACCVTVFTCVGSFINLVSRVLPRSRVLFLPLKVGQIHKPMSHSNTGAAANENIHPHD